MNNNSPCKPKEYNETESCESPIKRTPLTNLSNKRTSSNHFSPNQDVSWTERTEVITKISHENYRSFSRDLIEDVIQNVVESSSKNALPEDVKPPNDSVLDSTVYFDSCEDKENTYFSNAVNQGTESSQSDKHPLQNIEKEIKGALDLLKSFENLGISSPNTCRVSLERAQARSVDSFNPFSTRTSFGSPAKVNENLQKTFDDQTKNLELLLEDGDSKECNPDQSFNSEKIFTNSEPNFNIVSANNSNAHQLQSNDGNKLEGYLEKAAEIGERSLNEKIDGSSLALNSIINKCNGTSNTGSEHLIQHKPDGTLETDEKIDNNSVVSSSDVNINRECNTSDLSLVMGESEKESSTGSILKKCLSTESFSSNQVQSETEKVLSEEITESHLNLSKECDIIVNKKELLNEEQEKSLLEDPQKEADMEIEKEKGSTKDGESSKSENKFCEKDRNLDNFVNDVIMDLKVKETQTNYSEETQSSDIEILDYIETKSGDTNTFPLNVNDQKINNSVANDVEILYEKVSEPKNESILNKNVCNDSVNEVENETELTSDDTAPTGILEYSQNNGFLNPSENVNNISNQYGVENEPSNKKMDSSVICVDSENNGDSNVFYEHEVSKTPVPLNLEDESGKMHENDCSLEHVPQKGSYNFNYLDENIDPFATRCAVQNTPTKQVDLKSNSEDIRDKNISKSETSFPEQKNTFESKSEIEAATPNQKLNETLTIDVEDDKEMQCAFPDKSCKGIQNFPSPSQDRENKITDETENKDETSLREIETGKNEDENEDGNIPLPRSKSYDLDFLDENINPFKTNSVVQNSPPNLNLECVSFEHVEIPNNNVTLFTEVPLDKKCTSEEATMLEQKRLSSPTTTRISDGVETSLTSIGNGKTGDEGDISFPVAKEQKRLSSPTTTRISDGVESSLTSIGNGKTGGEGDISFPVAKAYNIDLEDRDINEQTNGIIQISPPEYVCDKLEEIPSSDSTSLCKEVPLSEKCTSGECTEINEGFPEKPCEYKVNRGESKLEISEYCSHEGVENETEDKRRMNDDFTGKQLEEEYSDKTLQNISVEQLNFNKKEDLTLPDNFQTGFSASINLNRSCINSNSENGVPQIFQNTLNLSQGEKSQEIFSDKIGELLEKDAIEDVDHDPLKSIRKSLSSIEFDEIAKQALELTREVDSSPSVTKNGSNFLDKSYTNSVKINNFSFEEFCSGTQSNGEECSDDVFCDSMLIFTKEEELDALSVHGNNSLRDDLARNSLFVKFDPLIASSVNKESDPRRGSSLISFSPYKEPEKKLTQTKCSRSELTFNDTTLVDESFNNDVNTTVLIRTDADVPLGLTLDVSTQTEEKFIPVRVHEEALKKQEIASQDALFRKMRELESIENVFKIDSESKDGEIESLKIEGNRLRKLINHFQNLMGKIMEKKEAMENDYQKQIKVTEEKHKEEVERITLENQQQQEELSSMEKSFYELVRKQERLRQVIDSLKKNGAILEEENSDLKSTLSEKQEGFKSVLFDLEQKMKEAEEWQVNETKKHENEMNKTKLLLKRAEMKIISLMDTVQKKEQENKMLSDLLDDCSNKFT